MNEEFCLSDKERQTLEEYHRACADKKTADKIKAVLLIHRGFTYSQIEKILLLDERTLNRYKKLYKEQGMDGLTADNYQGAIPKLNEEKLNQLKQELDSKIYRTSQQICDYVKKTFGVVYEPNGMTQTLKRLGYSYKKATSVPGKIDEKKQREFIETYQKEYKTLPDNENIYFMDATHPTYNNHIGYGWIKKGGRFDIKSQDGRKRINLLGAYNPKDARAVVKGYETINRESIIDFMVKLRRMNGQRRLHIICDNAKYHHARAVRERAQELNIHIVYLPGYSPNLNLIERYWGFLKKHILENHHYETFERFKEAIMRFVHSKSERLRQLLQQYIPEKFHLIKPAFT